MKYKRSKKIKNTSNYKKPKSPEHKAKLAAHLALVRKPFPRKTNIINMRYIREKYKECLTCGSSKNLQVHHIIPGVYDKKNQQYVEADHSLSNLQVLCSSCHLKKHYRELSRKPYNNRDPKTGRLLPKYAKV